MFFDYLLPALAVREWYHSGSVDGVRLNECHAEPTLHFYESTLPLFSLVRR